MEFYSLLIAKKKAELCKSAFMIGERIIKPVKQDDRSNFINLFSTPYIYNLYPCILV
jgi:hypothetical protein